MTDRYPYRHHGTAGDVTITLPEWLAQDEGLI